MIRGRRPYTPHQGAALDPTHLDAPQFNVSGSTCETVSQSKKIGDLTSDFLTGENSTTYYWDVVEAVLAGAGVPPIAKVARYQTATRRSDRQPKKNRKAGIGAEGLGVAGNAGRSPMTSRRLRTVGMGLRPKPPPGLCPGPDEAGRERRSGGAAAVVAEGAEDDCAKTVDDTQNDSPTSQRARVASWRRAASGHLPRRSCVQIFSALILSDRATALVEVH